MIVSRIQLLVTSGFTGRSLCHSVSPLHLAARTLLRKAITYITCSMLNAPVHLVALYAQVTQRSWYSASSTCTTLTVLQASSITHAIQTYTQVNSQARPQIRTTNQHQAHLDSFSIYPYSL